MRLVQLFEEGHLVGIEPDVEGTGRVVEVRDEYMPVIGLEDVFQVPRFDFEHVAGIMVVVEAEGGRVALLVDELLGQQLRADLQQRLGQL